VRTIPVAARRAEREITADIELIAINNINEAYERMLKSDVKYRFVIDMATVKDEKKITK
jgi:alcohol dehydrogenase (NADP+)